MAMNAESLASSIQVSSKVHQLLQKRFTTAQEQFSAQLQAAVKKRGEALLAQPASPGELWQEWFQYSVDSAQRSLLMLDTLRQRGNDFVAHQRAGMPPLLHFDYEVVLDARQFGRPVNYALVRIVPPEGVVVDERRRPYVVIDPRAGHGPGIGGFKDDSQVGVALRDGHPVYFVIFFPEPEEGQTLPDVCVAEAEFIRKVRALHPDSPKPAIVGNCQGGWAAMMLAASNADDTGPLVINGAPMSYWGGAWTEGEGDNPMRYSGGLLGGSWLASLVSDLSNGKFDGAWLVQNFENLHPANTFWDKYYHVYANVDTEPARFLEFERWWGGFYLLNREEIEWIVQNLFVGNRLWSGAEAGKVGGAFDLREVKSPIVLFASLGDNITPPQQAFNWVADIYGSTEEIKARGQVIVGLLHEDIGHLGIFVSGKVARKEHAQIVSVLKSIEALPPGLYGMQIHETERGGRTEYEVQFVERRLEEVAERLNRFKRADEKAFEAAADVSELNQAAYELLARPVVQAMSNETVAKLMRDFQPLRAQRSAISDLNPWLWWVGPAAAMVAAQRQAVEPDQRFRQIEGLTSDMISASLDFYRHVRDALSEGAFFEIYGKLLALRPEASRAARTALADTRESPYVTEALASIAKGGYPEAVARVAYLLKRKGEPLPLAWIETRQELIGDYRSLLPDTTLEEQRRVRGRQEIIVDFEPERALETLPQLLARAEDRERLLALLDRVMRDPRVLKVEPTAEQRAMLDRIHGVLGNDPAAAPRLPAPSRGAARGRKKS
jgi:pimeloyl-ACP methyl ester carboxylesterase